MLVAPLRRRIEEDDGGLPVDVQCRRARSIDALERLLHADGRVRLIAMQSLAHMGSAGSIPAIARAVLPHDDESRTVAVDAMTFGRTSLSPTRRRHR